MKTRKKISFLMLLLLVSACEKQELIKWNLTGTAEVNEITLSINTLNHFLVQANYINNGNDKNAVHGFVYSTSIDNPTIKNCDSIIYLSSNKLERKTSLINWSNSHTVFVKAFIINKIDTVYSKQLIVNWEGSAINLPQVITSTPSEIQFFKAKLSSQITYDGGLDVNKLGVYISTNSNPNESNSIVIDYNSNQLLYSKLIDGLSENTTYYVRGFAENTAGLGLANNIINFTTKNYYQIGETGPAGGLIFFNKIDTTGGWNFLECYPNELTTLFPWNFNINQQLNLGTEIGTGRSNTQDIVSFFGNSTNYAAKYCDQLNFGGYNDWFLPSRDELIEIYQSLYASNIGGFVNDSKYWSSSADDFFIQNAWCQKMTINTGSVNAISEQKNINLKVRPIRCF